MASFFLINHRFSSSFFTRRRQHSFYITALLDYQGRQLVALLNYRPSTSALGSMGKVMDLTNPDEEITIKRKPRASTSARYFKRLSAQAVAYGIPLLRYSIVPGLLFASIYYTEPQPTLLELLNPFF